MCEFASSVPGAGRVLRQWHPALAAHTQFTRKGSQDLPEKWLNPRLWQGYLVELESKTVPKKVKVGDGGLSEKHRSSQWPKLERQNK